MDAFWDLFCSTAFKQITVARVCRRAQVTRSTFYRHFSNLLNLLDQIEKEAIPVTIPAAIVDAFRDGDTMDTVWTLIMNNEGKLRRICFLLSSAGDPRFARRFKQAMADAFTASAGTTVDDLEPEQRVKLEFIFSGFNGLLAYFGDTDSSIHPADALKLVMPVLKEYFEPFLNAQPAVSS